MPKRSSKERKRPRDINALASMITGIATGEIEDREPEKGNYGKNPAAVALGRLGGKKGGKARAEKLSAERRREIAQKAASVRWQGR